MLFSIITLYPLLPILAHGQQQQQQDLFPFSYPTTTATTTSKNQTSNDINSESRPLILFQLTIKRQRLTMPMLTMSVY